MRPRLHAEATTPGPLARAWLGLPYPSSDDMSTAAPSLVLDGRVRPAFSDAADTLRDLATRLSAATILVGAHRTETTPGRSRPVDAWRDHLAEWGGCGASANTAGACCPRPAAVLLGPEIARIFHEKCSAGETPADALAALLATRDHWHHPALDALPSATPRVLQVVAGLQLGGAERLVVALTEGLRHFDYGTELAVVGRTVRGACPEPAGTRRFAGFGDRDAQCRAVAKFAVSGAFDLVHAHLLTGDELNLLAESGMPLLTTVHNTREGWPEGLEESAATPVACTETVAAQLRETMPTSRVLTVENPALNADMPRPDKLAARARLGLPADAIVLVAVANFRPQKRLERLPDIAAAFASRCGNPAVHLLIAGEAASPACLPLVDAFDAAAARHTSRVVSRRLGLVPDPADLLAAADVFVSSSEHEGSSLAQLEALAFGVPVVATAVGAAPDLEKRGADIVTVPPDAGPEAFAEKLATHLASPRRTGLPADYTPYAWLSRHDFLYTRERVRAALAKNPTRDGVFLVTNNLAPGGAQSGARRLLGEFRRRGLHTEVFLLLESPEHPTPGTLALREAGVAVTPLTPAFAGVDAVAALRPLFEMITVAPPSAVLLWNALPESKVALAETLAGILPVIDASPGEMFHTSLDRYFLNPRPGSPIRDKRAYAALLADLVVKYAGEASRARGELGVEPTVILNGVPLAPCRIETDTFRRPVIGTLARIAPQKKLERLLAAFRLLRERGVDAELRVAGDPEHDGDDYAASLRASVADLPVSWVGHRENTAEFLAGLDIFALVAEPAGCPNASLEAMAAGLPVVATAAGAIPEQIQDDVTGLITPRADVEALADALARLVADGDLRRRLGAAAREAASTRFSVARMADDYLRILGIPTPIEAKKSASFS